MATELPQTRWFGAWEVLDELESGGMGQVLIARRRGPAGFERLAAVKTLRAELRGSEPLRRMFLDEAQLLARLSHPAIAQIYDFGEHDGALFLVMELVAGVNLRHVASLRPPPTVSARLIAAALRGLHAAHELTDLRGQPLGVVHRDVSPDNLMLTFEGQVKVLDFGIALVRGRTAPVTELGLIKGKPPYLSPEQVKNQPLDRRTDVWSAAVVLHELLTGAPLFEGDSVYAIARVIAEAPLSPPSAIAGPLPPGLDEAVLRGLARDAPARWPTAQAFAEALEAAAIGGEDLPSFAARALGPARIAHREAMRRVLEGDAVMRSRARASGVVTALSQAPADEAVAGGPVQDAEIDVALRRTELATPPEMPAVVAETQARRGRWWMAVAVIAFALIGGAIVLTREPRTVASGSGSGSGSDSDSVSGSDSDSVSGSDSGSGSVSGSVPVAAAAPDAGAEPVVAAAPIDAGAPRPATRDRRRPTPAPPPTSAPATSTSPPAEPAATGTGTVTIAAKPFATIKIDGVVLTTTPVFNHPLAAGSHEIVLLDPASGAERLRRTIRIRPGGHESIVLGQ